MQSWSRLKHEDQSVVREQRVFRKQGKTKEQSIVRD